jgi:autotransporter-associated beta strand protein
MNQASNSVLPAMGRVVEAWELADGGAIHWDAGGGTGNTRVGTPANWQSDTLPPFDGSARVAFGVGGAAATIDAPVGFRGILFNRDADFTLDGEGVLTLGEGGLAATLPSATSRRYALAADVALAAHQHWGVTNNAAGTATLEVSGAITDGAAAYGITLSGGGRLVLSGANDYDGPTAVRGGTLTVAPGSNLGNSRNIVVDGAALVLQSQTAIDDNATLAILNGAKVSVGSGLTESLHRLVLDGVAVSGVWGSSVSGADHVDDARFEGGGRLRVLGPDPSRHALPYRESFEGFATGFLLPGFEGWSAGDNGAGLVAAEGPAPLGVLAYTAAVGYPLRHAAHAKVAVFGRALTNALSAPVDAAVWCDLMAQLVRAGEALSPPSSDLQCAFALDADGRLNVWHRDVEGGTNRWTALAWQTPAMVVWARVALHLDYATFDATHNARYFRIFIDGAAQSHTRAYTANDGGGAPGGTWFAFAAAAPNRINSLFFDGGGALDDVVVDTARPLIGLAPLGTPEWWLADAGLTNQLGLAENELEDADDDGFPNWKEHGAGTDPHDPESLLRVTDLPVLPNGRLAAVVQTVPGRRYALEGSSDLASDVWEPAAFAPTPDGEPAVQTAIAATTTMTLYVETAEAHRFYRVQVVRRE